MNDKEEVLHRILDAISEIGFQIEGMTGAIAGLQIRVAKLEGNEYPPELTKIWLKNTVRFLGHIEEKKSGNRTNR